MTIRAISLCAALWAVALAAAAKPPSPAAAGMADIRARIDALAGVSAPAAATESDSGEKAVEATDAEATEGDAAESTAETESAPVAEEAADAVADVPPESEHADAEASGDVPAEAEAAEAATEAALPHADEAETTTESVEGEEPPPAAVPATVRVVYPDLAPEKFRVEDWAGELVDQRAEEGEHVRNGWTLVVVRMVWNGNPRFRRVAAKGRALEILREHHLELPAVSKLNSRILADVPEEDGAFTFVAAFRLPE